MNKSWLSLLTPWALVACVNSGPGNLTTTTFLKPTVDCIFGVNLTQSGPDKNNNGTLEADEVSQSSSACADVAARFTGHLYKVRSPDNHQLLWSSHDGAVKRVLATTDTENGWISRYSLSPDMSQVAFLMYHDAGDAKELYVKDLLTEGPLINVSGELVSGGDVTFFEWSFDGSQLAMIGDIEIDNRSELFTVAADGSDRLRVNPDLENDRNVNSFRWSPTELTLAYSADINDDDHVELFVVNSDGSGQDMLSPVSAVDRNVSTFAWSPDGQSLAFNGDFDTLDQVYNLYTINLEDAGLNQVSQSLTLAGGVSSFEWSPDSSALAYRANMSNVSQMQLFRVDRSGDNWSELTGPLVAGGNLISFEWSPTSGHVAFLADATVNDQIELYTVNADGSDRVSMSDSLVGGGVDFFRWHGDGVHITLKAEGETVDAIELYRATAGEAGLTKLHQDYVAGQEVVYFSLNPENLKVAYVANQEDIAQQTLLLVDENSVAVETGLELQVDAFVVHMNWHSEGRYVGIYGDLVVDNLYDHWIYDSEQDVVLEPSQLGVDQSVTSPFTWAPGQSPLLF